uniref:Small ribosomal subunit protein uS9m n=1 Tax=Graphocephala atropunctata TaxID=36148 RepID=A0A1B6M7P8_9HEMI
MFIVRNTIIHHGKLINNFPFLGVFEDVLNNSVRRLSTTQFLREEENTDKIVEYGIKEEKTSKAMRAYLERSQAYNKFMAQEQEEYKTGKRHLANMMGKDPETFTQSDVNEAIEYLLPSGLFVKNTRPFLKPPEEVHPPKKEAEFDETGRPHHFLFYTGKPNLYEYLHRLVKTMKELNAFEDTMIRKQLKPDPALALTLEGSQWLSKEQFERKFLEQLTIYDYRQLIATIERLASHPFSYRVKDIISEAQVAYTKQSGANTIPKPELQEDGREFVSYKDARRKSAHADVIVRSPGTGLMSINGYDLSYFEDFQAREQLLFPLHFSGQLNVVDIEATVRGGGPTGQSGALRFAIAMALRSFVPPAMIEQMRLVGLLTQDKRRRERKKPGQEKARRKFTWKKR